MKTTENARAPETPVGRELFRSARFGIGRVVGEA